MDIINDCVFIADSGNETISLELVRDLVDKFDSMLPDDCWLRTVVEDYEGAEEDVVECTRKGCNTSNDFDAKFCKECGARITDDVDQVRIPNLQWNGEQSCESWGTIFVNEVVPHIRGLVHGAAFYGDPDDTSVPWKNFYFSVHNGRISYHTLELPDADGPVFEVEEV